MKTSKSPESAEVTPSKKKLKQARLPFKLISEVSPVPVTPPSRKRKLSATDADSIPKGKITKENDEVESLVISDDDEGTADKAEKQPNPFVKLVDTAFKKKQKAKGKKKRNSKKSLPDVKDSSVETKCDNGVMEGDETKECDNEVMELDETAEEIVTDAKETEIVNKAEEVVVLEDSNSSVDVKQRGNKLCDASNNSNDEFDAKPEIEEVLPSEKSIENTENSLDKTNEDPKSDDMIKTPITPKRSTRKKANEENNNKGSPSSKLNESVTSDPTTPRQTRSSSVAKDEANVTPKSNLTPKQLQKQLESAKKREKLEKEKQEREKKRQEEKDERAKQRQEKEDQKKKEREEKEEVKRKEREEKEELRKKEKEEKERQKELEKKQREEKEEQKRKEKEEKEEQRKKEKEAREEERRKRQEAVELEKHEQEAKKKKAAEAFANFFVPKQKTEKDQPTVGAVNNSMLSSFTIKSDMRLAPTTRVQLSDEKAKTLEKLMKEQSIIESKLYVKSLRSGAKAKSSGKTWPLSDKDDDVILVEDELPPSDGAGEIMTCDLIPREKLRPKLFSFHENRRPPYWGTWRKKSAVVKPRKPFGQDEKQLDYEVDSDEDWEEEQEGESLDGSAAGSDDEQEPNDEYEVDNEVFVPHGYLSDEEATMDEDDVLSLSPETQKARLKHLEDEFESEMKKPTEKLKPRLYGLLWEKGEGGKPENCVDAIWDYFGKLSMVMNDPTPLLQPSKDPEETEKKKVKKKKQAKESDGDQSSPKTDKKKKTKSTDEKEPKPDKKSALDLKKNQPGINMFLKKIQS